MDKKLQKLVSLLIRLISAIYKSVKGKGIVKSHGTLEREKV